jgi:hypothetical protein
MSAYLHYYKIVFMPMYKTFSVSIYKKAEAGVLRAAAHRLPIISITNLPARQIGCGPQRTGFPSYQ